MLLTGKVPAQQPNPPLANIKAAAEAGDAVSQDKLGDTFYYRGDPERAVKWYRLAAAQGIPNSQYRLAHTLLFWASNARPSEKAKSQAYSDEAIAWLLKAAAKGHKRAQVDLGQLYQDGKLLKKDLPEAYKWFSLAAGAGTPLDANANIGKLYRDGAILNMTQEQIADGNQRVTQFLANPAKPVAIPEPAYLQGLKLQGISGTADKPLAIINGKTLAPNDSATLKLDSRSVTIRCLSITPTTVTISIDGSPITKELALR